MTASDRIRTFAARIERLDDEIKALNADKKEIYAEMKGEGFDTKAFKAAHRRHLAHAQNPTTAQEGEALTDIYFVALHGSEASESQPAAKFGAANGIPESPTRTRTEETNSAARGPSRQIAGEGSAATSASPAHVNLGSASAFEQAPVVSTPSQPVPQTHETEQAAGFDPPEPAADLSIPDFLRRNKIREVA